MLVIEVLPLGKRALYEPRDPACNNAFMPCSGIVLCGGRGSRVGGADKGLLEYGEQTLVQQVLSRVAPQVDDIVISANRNLARYAGLGHPIIEDGLVDYQGPLAGVSACLPHCRHERVLVVPCDMPELPANLAQGLLAQLDGKDICYAWDGRRDQYLVAAWHRALAPDLASYLERGGRSVHGWYAGLNVARIDFSGSAGSFANLNTLPA